MRAQQRQQRPRTSGRMVQTVSGMQRRQRSCLAEDGPRRQPLVTAVSIGVTAYAWGVRGVKSGGVDGSLEALLGRAAARADYLGPSVSKCSNVIDGY